MGGRGVQRATAANGGRSSYPMQPPPGSSRRRSRRRPFALPPLPGRVDDGDCDDGDDEGGGEIEGVGVAVPVPVGRRDFAAYALIAAAGLTAAAAVPSPARASSSPPPPSLDSLSLGRGRWVPKSVSDETSRDFAARIREDLSALSRSTSRREVVPSGISSSELAADLLVVPAPFAAYLTRFLIRYDAAAARWWREEVSGRYSLLSAADRSDRERSAFGRLARSVSLSAERYVLDNADYGMGLDRAIRDGFGGLLSALIESYGGGKGGDGAAEDQILLLFGTLPGPYQPIEDMKGLLKRRRQQQRRRGGGGAEAEEKDVLPLLTNDLTSLLPPSTHSLKYDEARRSYSISPPLDLYPTGSRDDGAGASAAAEAVDTPLGPVASVPLRRERPYLGPSVYALLGLSGGLGCALTHSTVIPLDVVKTRIQTERNDDDGGGGGQQVQRRPRRRPYHRQGGGSGSALPGGAGHDRRLPLVRRQRVPHLHPVQARDRGRNSDPRLRRFQRGRGRDRGGSAVGRGGERRTHAPGGR